MWMIVWERGTVSGAKVVKMTKQLFNQIEGRIVGSLLACDGARLCARDLEEASILLLEKFHRKRDLGLSARDHVQYVVERSKQVRIDYDGGDTITIRTAKRHERPNDVRKGSAMNSRRRVKLDSRHTRSRRPQTAAA